MHDIINLFFFTKFLKLFLIDTFVFNVCMLNTEINFGFPVSRARAIGIRDLIISCLLQFFHINSFLRGRVDYFSFFDCSSPFCFLIIEFHCTFSISYKILTNYVYYCCILMRPSGLLFSFVPALRLSILTPLIYFLRLFFYLLSFLLFP